MKFKETSDAKKGGLFVGKSHAEGGIAAIVTDTGTPIEVEGGEAIINKEATAKHWKELSKINQSAGNGVPIPPPNGVSEEITQKLAQGGKLTQKDRKAIYTKWKSLVNMTASELEKYYNSEDGKSSGLTASEAQKQGIDSGRESARWIIKMKRTKVGEWTSEMWKWANKQISFVSRMKGLKGDLFDEKGKRTRKLKALLIWGHNPKKYKGSFEEGGITVKEFFETEKKPWQNEEKSINSIESNDLLAPNGKPSNLTPEQYKLVRTAEFKAWFGDWEKDPENSSKVVDENGEPKVVYHGSISGDINIFDRTQSKRLSSGLKEFGTYFTDNYKLAELYKSWGILKKEEKLKLEIEIQKLQDIQNNVRNNKDFYELEEKINNLQQIAKGKIYPVFLNLKKIFSFDAKGQINIEAWNNLEVKASYKWAINRDAMEFLKEGKFGVPKVDGIEAKNIVDAYIPDYKSQKELIGTAYLVFDDNPNFIKLADGRNTTFHINNADIRFDDGGITVKEFFETEKKPWQNEVTILNDDDSKTYYQRTYYNGTKEKFSVEEYEKNELPKLSKGGRTIAQTPSPKKDRIFGSEKNRSGSSRNLSSARSIDFDDKTLGIIENKVDEHNKEYPDKRITLASAKAVVRRGMGAYSVSHRPTISDNKPNSRTAWGIARLNAFIYKIINGESKSGKYTQDDDLIKELGYSVKKYEDGGTTDDSKIDKIKSLLLQAFPYLKNLDFIGKGLTGYAFLTELNSELVVVKYSQSVTEFWLTQMAMVSNPPNIVEFTDAKQLSDNFEYGIIHKYVSTDGLPNKYVWNYSLGFFPNENKKYLSNVPEKEIQYVSNLAKTKAKSLEDYFGVTLDTNASNWGYDENGNLVLFDIDGNISKPKFLEWMSSRENNKTKEYAEGGVTDTKDVIFDNGSLQIRNIGGSKTYYKKVDNKWEFLSTNELEKLKEGSKHELEHSKTIKSIINPEYSIEDIASAIAWDHLLEDIEYYNKLSKIESVPETKKFATGDVIQSNDNKMKAINTWNEVPSNWKNVKGIKSVNFSYSPYDDKLQGLVKNFVSKDSLRASLTGMYFDESGLTVTDAHKLLHIHFNNTEFSGIYPTAFSAKSIGYKGMSKEEIQKQIQQEKFPAYRAVIPKSFTEIKEFDVLKLRQYANASMNYANPVTHGVLFKINEERIGYNIDFLLDCIDTLIKIKPVDKLYFHYNNPNGAVIISAVKNFDEDKDTYALLMPLLLEKQLNFGTFNEISKIYFNVYFDFTDGEIHNADGSIANIETTYEDNAELPLEVITLLEKNIKLASSKKSIYILNDFLATDKYLLSSNLTSEILIKNDYKLSPGVYSIKNNAVQIDLSEDSDSYAKRIPFEKSDEDAVMSSRSFIFYIEKAAECVGEDELRPLMSGILVDIKENGIFFASTDAHVLCKLNVSQSFKLQNKELVGKQFVLGSIKQLSNFLSFIDCDSVQIAFSDKHYRITCGNKMFSAELIEGKFPNYEAVIPYSNNKMVTFDAKKIYECINNTVAKEYIKENEIKPNDLFFFNRNNELFISWNKYAKSSNDENIKICEIDVEAEEANSTIDINSSIVIAMPIMSEATHFAFKVWNFNKIMSLVSKDVTTFLYSDLSRAYVVSSKNLYYNEEKFNDVVEKPKKQKTEKPKETTTKSLPKISSKGKVLKVKDRLPKFKIGDSVIVTYGEEAGKKGKITQVFSYEKYPESMKPDEIPYYEITNVGKEIPESNLTYFSESKKFPDARDKKDFIQYVNQFYGKDDSLYGKDFPNKGFTIAEIEKAVNQYLRRKDLDWGNGDSVDREQVRDILWATLQTEKPKEKKKTISKQDYQDAIDGIELLIETAKNPLKKQLQEYLDGLKVMVESMK
jgi:DNA polymerase III sliding clamp (beta) subunit (PCNA family)